MNGVEGLGGIVGGETAGKDEGDLRVALGEVAGEGPVEGFAGAAVIGAGGGIDEEGEVFAGEFVVGEFGRGDRTDDGNVLIEEEGDVVGTLVAVELDDVDEAFVEEVEGEGAGVVDEDADAEDIARDVRDDGGGFFGRAVSF